MQISRLSRLSFHLVAVSLFFTAFVSAQQKANDFKQRLTFIDGKLSKLSGRFFSTPRLSEAYSRRIKIEEWPSKFSPFGGKRFTTNDIQGLIKKRVPHRKVENKPVHVMGKVRGTEDLAKGLQHENRYTSTSTVEFRDAYYAKLNQRMDEWMEKVNNLSLRDINRFQLRKGVSAEPGFPVQRAGSETGGLRTDATQVPRSSGLPSLPTSYRVGPRKVSTKSASINLPVSKPEVKPPAVKSHPQVGSPSRKSLPVPKLGPKKIRVQVRQVE